jgi:hypothetical protein
VPSTAGSHEGDVVAQLFSCPVVDMLSVYLSWKIPDASMCAKSGMPMNVRPQSFRVRVGMSESPVALAATRTWDGRKTARGDKKLRMM